MLHRSLSLLIPRTGTDTARVAACSSPAFQAVAEGASAYVLLSSTIESLGSHGDVIIDEEQLSAWG